jgi:pilus assembly protein CpaC
MAGEINQNKKPERPVCGPRHEPAFILAALLLSNPACPPASRVIPIPTCPMATVSRCGFWRSTSTSVVIDLSRDVKDVLVADPKIANAVVRSSQRAYIIGAAVGQTNVVFFDADGQQGRGL